MAKKQVAATGTTQAVVLSGGGAYGAYEIGVMKALFSGKSPATDQTPLDPDIFTGTSVGAFNASYMVSKRRAEIVSAIGQLESVWNDQIAEHSQNCGNGVFRLRFNPIDFIDPRCLLNQ